MISREISNKILSYAKQYPVVTITGPRRSGETTLARMIFPDKLLNSISLITGFIKLRISANPIKFYFSFAFNF